MHAEPLASHLTAALIIAISLGIDAAFDKAATGQEMQLLPDPTWKRLGLPESPTSESGAGVGVVLLDDIGLHPSLRPMGARLRHLIVDRVGNVSLVEPIRADKTGEGEEYTHGVEALLQMASAPFEVGARTYGGLAPGASYFVIPYLSEESDDGNGRHPRYDTRLDRAIEWVVANRERWNIRVILLETWFEYPPPPPGDPTRDGLLKNTREYAVVRGLEPAIKAGILVVTGNGNTSTENSGPPAEYLAVGAYHDSGRADPGAHRENPDEPWGRNGDGHQRPDVLAPKYHVPNHKTAGGEIGYFGGTSSASAQVAAVCALLFARFPDADDATVKRAILLSGDRLPGSHRPGVRVNAARAIRALEDRSAVLPQPRVPPPISIDDPNQSLVSKDEVERALAVSALAWHPERFRPGGGDELRQVFRSLLRDEAPVVRKAAASALGSPMTKDERALAWEAMRRERDMGVRGQLAILLLDGSREDHPGDWVALARDPNWTARWCAAKVLREHHPDAPILDHAFLPEDIDRNAEPILAWYRKKGPPDR